MHGGNGFDRLIGGPGSDVLWGDAGVDWFVFKGSNIVGGADTIADFSDGVDKVVIERLGVGLFQAGRANGTIFAYDDVATGDVALRGVTSDGATSRFASPTPERFRRRPSAPVTSYSRRPRPPAPSGGPRNGREELRRAVRYRDKCGDFRVLLVHSMQSVKAGRVPWQ